jgi:hypothetical protein
MFLAPACSLYKYSVLRRVLQTGASAVLPEVEFGVGKSIRTPSFISTPQIYIHPKGYQQTSH